MMRSCIRLDMAIAFRHIQSVKVLLACLRLKIVMFHFHPYLWTLVLFQNRMVFKLVVYIHPLET